ncbi:MAG TPA: hypothetical protein P5137_00825 [Candidatus Brocadiia bacterium]|nr:hypothetical protein [Candidatus Brocadiia bacterium]
MSPEQTRKDTKVAKILRQTTVVRDGFHNGFTDLAYWRDMYWVSYRRGSGHATMDGQAVVSVSTDRKRFRPAASIKLFGDNRDPKLFALSPERMACIVPTWEGAYRGDLIRTYVAFTNDGFNWTKPERILGPGQWLWRVRRMGDQFLGMVQQVGGQTEGPKSHDLFLMTSRDLLSWEPLAQVGTQEHGLAESDIVFRPDGAAWIILRCTKPPYTSYFAHAEPPYTRWELKRLDALIHAAVMLEHNGRVYVAGRSKPEVEGDSTFPSVFSLGVWEVEFGKVTPVLRIPAMGDCSYPGLIKDPDGRICMSYYSQHAYYMGVVPSDAPFANVKEMPDDVYFAELEL